ncbi:hypothetical protein C8Q80DRAFT_1137519 [Daedaleopsis nitida]|nr:hypothetical protein C8Q80DRAFT_1137519 [Daedaleopsis nitida]
MSSDSDDLTEGILEAYGRLVVENYCIIASSVILFADALFTLTDEIHRIWRRKFTGATLILLITRWVAVAERIVLVISVVLPTVEDKVCVPVLRLDDTLTDITYLMFGLFVMLRIRGVWGDTWIPVALVALLMPIRPIISVYIQTHYLPIAFGAPLYGCGSAIFLDRPVYERLTIVSKATSIAIDAAAVFLTWYKTYGIKRESRRLGLNTPYATLLLRDGTLYFLIILLVQLLGIVSITVGSNFSLFIVWPYFDQVFTVVFVSRFMLNLRGVYLSGGANYVTSSAAHSFRDRDPAATLSDIHFSASIIGNLGAPLHSSLGSHSLTDSSECGPSSTAVGGGSLWGGTDWEMEDEALETSSNPLFTGLVRDDGECRLEMASPVSAAGATLSRRIDVV